VQFVGSYCIAK